MPTCHTQPFCSPWVFDCFDDAHAPFPILPSKNIFLNPFWEKSKKIAWLRGSSWVYLVDSLFALSEGSLFFKYLYLSWLTLFWHVILLANIFLNVKKVQITLTYCKQKKSLHLHLMHDYCLVITNMCIKCKMQGEFSSITTTGLSERCDFSFLLMTKGGEELWLSFYYYAYVQGEGL